MADRTIIVAGSGRCGSSLVMQMLAAAKVPCIGTHPDYECADTLALMRKEGGDFVGAVQGKAVKILDPHRQPIPRIDDAVVIWLRRNANEQAKSMLKFMGVSGIAIDADRRTRRRLAKSFEVDQRRVPFLLRKHFGGHAVYEIDFEVILAHPVAFAHVLRQLLDLPVTTESAMASQVIHRGPECLPYMMEAAFIGAA